MGLADELSKEDPRVRCKACEWYSHLSPEDQDAFDGWITADKSRTALWRACVRDGMTTIGKTQFLVHIREHNDVTL